MKILAIDIGGTYIKYGIYDKSLKFHRREKTVRNKAGFLAQLKNIIEHNPVDAIAATVPGVFERKTGKIIDLPHLRFLDGFNLQKFLQQFANKVKIGNDVNCMMRAEAKLGAAKNYKNALLVAIGTGIGGGILIDGKIYMGSGAAGEFGHVILDDGKSFEKLASGSALKSFNQSEFNKVSKYVGQMIHNLVMIFDPQAVILSGGITGNYAKKFFSQAISEMRKSAQLKEKIRVKVLISKLGDTGGLVGAALLF